MELFTTDTWKKDKNERDLNKMRSKGNFDDLVSLSSLNLNYIGGFNMWEMRTM